MRPAASVFYALAQFFADPGTMPDFIPYLILLFAVLAIELLILRLFSRLPGKRFAVRRYVFMISPMLLLTFWYILQDLNLLPWFLVFITVGPCVEWLGGYFFHQITGSRFWIYPRYSVTGYTSLLVVPCWGMVGVIFGLMAKDF